MMMRRPFRLLVLLAACGLVSISCSSSSQDNPGYSSTGGSAGNAPDASGTGGTATGGSGGTSGTGATGATGGSGGATGGTSGTGGSMGGTGGTGGSTGGTGGTAGASGGAGGSGGGSPCGGSCPAGTTCGTANGIDVCRAQSGIPRFSHVFIIMMENTTLSTLQNAMNGGNAPNLANFAKNYATGSDYHGVAHPSLPNYIALTSGDTQGIGCDCKPTPQTLGCNAATCNLLLGTCQCDRNVPNIADQLKAANVSWGAFAEGMGTPCNLSDSGKYAVRHVPFLYYDNIQKNSARCNAHILDLSSFSPATAPRYSYIAPNTVHDMHDPVPAGVQNIKNGDAWIKAPVDAILASSAYKQGGLLVIVWDEDDLSGAGIGTDDPIPMFLMSPYAKSGGYVSKVKATHYSLLATIEDGLGLPRMGKAGSATPLSDYFPAK